MGSGVESAHVMHVVEFDREVSGTGAVQKNSPTTAIAQYPEADDGKSNEKVDRPQLLDQAHPWLHGDYWQGGGGAVRHGGGREVRQQDGPKCQTKH